MPISRIFRNEDFGYRTITVERPERDDKGKVVVGTKGKPVADTKLRDTENVALSEDVDKYFAREVLPHAPDAWLDGEKTKVGYEIPFNRHLFCVQAAARRRGRWFVPRAVGGSFLERVSLRR